MWQVVKNFGVQRIECGVHLNCDRLPYTCHWVRELHNKIFLTYDTWRLTGTLTSAQFLSLLTYIIHSTAQLPSKNYPQPTCVFMSFEAFSYRNSGVTTESPIHVLKYSSVHKSFIMVLWSTSICEILKFTIIRDMTVLHTIVSRLAFWPWEEWTCLNNRVRLPVPSKSHCSVQMSKSHPRSSSPEPSPQPNPHCSHFLETRKKTLTGRLNLATLAPVTHRGWSTCMAFPVCRHPAFNLHPGESAPQNHS